MRVQSDLLISSEAGETCRVPLVVLRPLAAGRPLDLELRDAAGDTVELLDPRGRLVASLPRMALLALPRIAASPELTRMLGSSTTTPGVASRSCSGSSPATRFNHSRPDAGNKPTGGGSYGRSPTTAPTVKSDQEV
jgi:hypothetical protein